MTPRSSHPVAPAGFWQRPAVAQALASRDIGGFLKLYQQWTGATQTQIATACEVPQSHISHIMRGKRQVTSLDMYERFARGLDIPRALLGLAEPAPTAETPALVERTGPDRRAVLAVTAATVVLAADDELDEVTRRMQHFAASNVDDAAVEQLNVSVDLIGCRYEGSDAAAVYPTALRQRRYVAELMSGHQHPRFRGELYVVAGKLSGLLGYLAFDLGNEVLARAYCNEAMSLAQAAGHRDLAAWVRGTQSFIAYYAGRYKQALDYARDGQRHAAGGPASIRLAISGEARTLGKLGDRRGVDDAVDRALAAHAQADHVDPVGYFLSFEPFGAARLAGNAASAYLALGAVDRVREFTDQAIPVFARSNSAASHALTLVDASMTYLVGHDIEPDRAGALVSEALTVGSRLRSQVVARRAQDFVTGAAPWAAVPEIAEVADAVAAWRTPAA
ncbi:helix-turn-helix domain-containing protein [Frankia sp. CNm7]|uniref:Helix-turn-helix domain-containing protein n=1 Tax=Frankia nepalensis TaxID=1836974 RepID=A0A937UNC3_9ACTN|nr:helix-turn-helix transcriptional regulator [Frankia nepalensis]MBL7498154.1 helix-turn-helix domain-containing protein [Frankia nepalensis]MBL7509328.1 helix-turn-helix domain-containing protein [Frankia nepalensis]MBL7516884.1 helix-turn-helix domain-containing protein [Frankia nepalensis]MBL7627943.1 helix-turn-helix domain-containing protein [Frankia nepalensis]